MSKTYYNKIDKYGFFQKLYLLPETPMIELDGEIVPDSSFIAGTIPSTVYFNEEHPPKWTGSEWVATAEPPKPLPPEPSENDYLMLAIADLDRQRAMDKTETELAIAELAETLIGGA